MLVIPSLRHCSNKYASKGRSQTTANGILIWEDVCNKVRKKEGSGQGWLVKTRVIYCTQINLNRCALCASSVHQLSRLSPRSLSVFVLAVSRTQTMRPSVHSVSPRILAPRWLYLVSPRQLLQSDTGVPHFALDPLTYRCLLSLSPAADFAEPRPPRHNV